MKYIALCFLFSLALNFSSVGQNLVPNGSFEEVINCPTTLSALHHDCADWYFGIQLPGLPWNEWPSPDWYHTCSPFSTLTPPSVMLGYQIPCEGEAYAGIATFDNSDLNYREIMSVELDEHLIMGEIYNIRFQVARSFIFQTGYATNNIGIRFTTFPYWFSEQDAISNWAHFKVEELIDDTLNWTLIEFEFVADSAYRYLHIGNFFTDENSSVVNISQEPLTRWAYYFIDCVEITKNAITSAFDFGGSDLILIYPNPSKDFITIDGGVLPRSVKFFDSMGRMVINELASNNELRTIDISSLSKGLYILEIENESNSVTKTKLIKTK
jgi:hypothetical protein